MFLKLFIISIAMLSIHNNSIFSQCGMEMGCPNADYSNYGLYSNNDPASIEYDNIICSFHSNIIRNENGTFTIWGEKCANNGTSNLLSPTIIDNTSFPLITGIQLKAVAVGKDYANRRTHQHMMLTTDGLYIWGDTNTIVDESLVSISNLQKLNVAGNPTGLPNGISPLDVKMLFGTTESLVITTCSGEVYTLSMNQFARGDGLTGNESNWSQVMINNSTPLTGIIATRGWYNNLVALRNDNTLWTWGESTFLGDNSNSEQRDYATQMTLPPMTAPIKMIGMTGRVNFTTGEQFSSYYILSTDGKLYTMGDNNRRQLGDFTMTQRRSWVMALESVGNPFNNVAWISPNEHDNYRHSPAISLITTDSILYNFGSSEGYQLGRGSNAMRMDPGIPPGTFNSHIIATETGGHLMLAVKKCSENFYYAGHRYAGSMGNGSGASFHEDYFTDQTAQVSICGAISVLNPQIQSSFHICENDTLEVILNNNFGGTVKWQIYDSISDNWVNILSNNLDTIMGDTLNIVLTENSCLRAEIEILDCNVDYHYSNVICITTHEKANYRFDFDSIICQNDSNKYINLIGLNGVTPYTFTYTIENDTFNIQTVNDTSKIVIPSIVSDTLNFQIIEVQESSGALCKTLINNQVNVIIKPLPSTFMLNDTIVCQYDTNTVVKINVNNGEFPFNIIYTINNDTFLLNLNYTDTSLIVNTNQSDTLIYNLIHIEENSLQNCSSSLDESIQIIINPEPQAFFFGDTIVCQNADAPSILFIGANGTPPYLFTYVDGNDTLNITAITDSVFINIPTDSAGIKSFELISVKDASVNNCEKILSELVTVTILPTPIASFYGDTTICQDADSIEITLIGLQGVSPYTITYLLNQDTFTINSIIDTAYINIPTQNSGNFIYHFIKIEDNNLITCQNQLTDSITITINETPNATILGDTIVCQNSDSISFTLHGIFGETPYIFSIIHENDTIQLISQTDSFFYSIPTIDPDTLQFKLIKIQESSVISCNQNYNDSITIIINPKPSVIVPNDFSICLLDTTAVFSYIGQGGTSPYTFTYMIDNDTFSLISNRDSVSFFIPSQEVDTLFIKLLEIIDDSPSSCSYQDELVTQVIVKSLPNVNLLGDTIICKNSSEPLVSFEGINGFPPYIFTYSIGLDTFNLNSNTNLTSISIPTNQVDTISISLISV